MDGEVGDREAGDREAGDRAAGTGTFAARLLAGPSRRARSSAAAGPLLAAIPLMLLVLGACLIAADAGLRAAFPGVAGWAWRTLPVSGVASVLCLTMAAPVALGRPGAIWLVPVWLTACVGPAGWSLIGMPDAAFMRVLGVALLLLPFMVLALAGAVPGGSRLRRAAAASGAGPWTAARLLARASFPGLVRSLLAAFVTGAALLSE